LLVYTGSSITSIQPAVFNSNALVGKSGLYSFLTQPIETNPPTPSNTFAQSKIALAKSIKTKFKNMQHLYTILHHNLMIIIYMFVNI